MISSTVLDFIDSRKILKGVLKSAGYNVIISEDGDIKVDSGQTIFDNCLEAVESSDIVITLIGSRYGSLYNESEEISITRQEYRHALLHNKRRLIFINNSVWNARKIYKEYLNEGYDFKKSDIITDMRILSFIDEVVGNEEWILQFNNVIDLIALVKKQLNIVDPKYEFYYQSLKGNPRNPDGTFNYEVGFKNISGAPLFEFELDLDFNNSVISIDYDFSRSSVNITGGKYLHNNNKSYEWRGQMLSTNGWIVFIIKSIDEPRISNIRTKHTGKIVSNGRIILGTE